MANNIDITLRGKDETGKAFDSAKARVNNFGKAAEGAKKPTQNMAEMLEKMGGAASGGATSIARLGQAFGGISGPMAQAGAVLGSFIVGWTTGQKLIEAGWFGRSMTAQAESDLKTLEAASRRLAALRAEQLKAATARVDVEDTGPGGTLRKATLQAENELAQANDAVKKAQDKLRNEEDKFTALKSKGLTSPEAKAKAEDAIQLARLEVKVTKEIAKLRKQASEDTVTAAKAVADLAAQDLAANIKVNRMKGEMDHFREATTATTQAIKDLDDALSGVGQGKRIKDLAVGALGGDKGQVEMMRAAQDQAKALDQVGEIERKKRDPEERKRLREVERERSDIEKKIARARDREEKGRPLARWEKELLGEANAAKAGAQLNADQRVNAQNVQKRQEMSADIMAGLNASKLGKMADDLKKLLTVAGGG